MKKSMKKFMIACAAVSSIAIAAGMSAMADEVEYDATNNAAPINVPAEAADGTQMTVLVVPTDKKAAVTDADILYINQAAKGELPATALLKGESLADGTYSVLVGYYNAENFTIAEDTFTIGEPAGDTRDILMGDVTKDKIVDSTDAQQILRYFVKGTAGFASDADAVLAANVTVPNDTVIDTTDAQQVLRFFVKSTSGSKAGQTLKFNASNEIVD